MVEVSLEWVLCFEIDGRKIEYPEIASRILSVIRLWNEKHTMGRSMTARVLSSIPSHTLYTYFGYFNVVYNSLNSMISMFILKNQNLLKNQQLFLKKEMMPPKRIVRLDEMCTIVSAELQCFLSHFESFKSSSSSQHQIEIKKNLLEKIRDYDPSDYGNDSEEYEVRINVAEVMSLCNEEKSRCYRELDALQRLEELVNHAIEAQVGIRMMYDRRIVN